MSAALRQVESALGLPEARERRSRQDEITTDIIAIAAGAEAGL